MHIVIVTGLSGAGKTTARRALEDVDFFCVDNLPLPLLSSLVELLGRPGLGAGFESLAVVIDARQHPYLPRYRDEIGRLRAAGHQVEVLFLEASDDSLLQRYSETRRRHPVAGDDLPQGIARDRQLLNELRHDAENAIVDTGNLNVHQLKGIIQERYGRKEGNLAITLLSFGFKHGLPREADVVFDCRFLQNPYFVETLSARTGRDPDVAKFVLDDETGRELLGHIEQFARFSLPKFEREGKLYLTLAVGCTGGRHRSVAVVEELGRRLGSEWDVVVRHRDLTRG